MAANAKHQCPQVRIIELEREKAHLKDLLFEANHKLAELDRICTILLEDAGYSPIPEITGAELH